MESRKGIREKEVKSKSRPLKEKGHIAREVSEPPKTNYSTLYTK
jgi:hypothetical protein